MAFYGIQSSQASVTASDANDVVRFQNGGSSTFTGASVLGLDGSDLISIGTQGQTRTAIASGSPTTGRTGVTKGLKVRLFASAGTVYTGINSFTGIPSGTIAEAKAIGVVTSQQALRTVSNAGFYANAGNDTIALGNQLASFSASTVGGGAGNDLIGTLNAISSTTVSTATNTAGDWNATFIEGGGGDDTITISAAAKLLNFSASTLQGSQGNDVINVVTTGSFVQSFIAGGGGNDLISASVGTATTSTIAGGGGDDTIRFSAEGETATKNLILGDANNSISQYDGNDSIILALSATDLFTDNTVQAGGGNDVLRITANATDLTASKANLYSLQAGNDIFSADTNLTADTIQAGAGSDTIVFASAAKGVLLNAGGDSDNITFGGTISGAASIYTSTTVFGGEGADIFSATTDANTGESLGMRFAWSAASDSTLSAMDTIAIGGNNGSGTTYDFRYEPGSLVLGSFVTAGSQGTALASATNGVVTFGADAPDSLTARIALLDASMTTEGSLAIFNDSTNTKSYLFIQGGSTDLVANFGTAATVSGASISIAGGRQSFSANLA